MSQLLQMINETEERFVKIAPSTMQYETEKGFAIQLLQNDTYLKSAAKQSPKSFAHAITNVAAIGLSLNPAEKQAYLITRNVKVSDNKYERRVFLEPSYMGLLRLATDSGSIEWIKADVVYSSDEFIDNGPGEKPTHKYSAFSKNRGEIDGVYCCAKTKDGDYLTTIMPVDDINNIRARSEAWKRKQSGPWKTDYNEMAKKAVIRRAFKTWPRTNIHMTNAVHLSNENEGFDPIETTPEINEYTPKQKEYYDQLISNSDALGMFVFRKTIDETIWTGLYHTFPRGEKGKYQAIVNNLESKGHDIYLDYQAAIEDALTLNDPVALSETTEGLSDDAIDLIKAGFSEEQSAIYSELIGENHEQR